MSSPRVEVHADASALATAIAGELLSRLASAQEAGRVPQIALTGGTIADHVHREVARLSSDAGVNWSNVVVWWGDERFVEADSAERNAGQARAAFLDTVGVDPAHVHEMASTDTADSVEEGAASYELEVREHGSGEFEIVMLGVGPDGHIASLFPGHPALDVDDRIAVPITDSPKPPPQRISLTFAALSRARSVWFLVSGTEKADAVARALGGSSGSAPADLHEIPAVGVQGQDETIWFLDRDAATAL